MSNDHVLWIGGPSGVGKSTVARLFARRHGLRWYSSDTQTWEHRDRALALGDPAAQAWEAMTPDERSSLPPEETIRLGLDRSQMILDDLEELPKTPAVIVDGTTVTPDLIGDSKSVVWLFASAQARDSRVRQRGWGAVNDETNELRAHLIKVASTTAAGESIDTSNRTVAVILDMVDEVAGSWLARQQRATSIGERRQLIRAGNVAIVRQYRAGLARPWATADPRSIIRAYDCECAQLGCTSLVDQPLSDFPLPYDDESPILLASGHTPS